MAGLPARLSPQLVEDRAGQLVDRVDDDDGAVQLPGDRVAPGHAQAGDPVLACAVDVVMTIAHHDRAIRTRDEPANAEVREGVRDDARLARGDVVERGAVHAVDELGQTEALADRPGVDLRLGGGDGEGAARLPQQAGWSGMPS